MGSEAVLVRLGDVCTKIGSGATPRGGKEAYLGGLYSLIRSQNVYNHGFERDGIAHINEDQAAKLSNVEVKAADVLLNITGDSVARCCQVPDDVLPARVNQHVAIIRPDPNQLDAQYLRYYLVTPKIQSLLLSQSSAGATRPALTKGMIEDLEIILPTLPEQRRIAKILGDLDDKIEINRKMNETLEATARALFKSWFVDFDPVRAKMEGRQPEGMDAETAALFPEKLVESELGMIPEGWEVKYIGDLAEIVGGSTPKTEKAEYWVGGTHHWVTPKDLSRLSVPVLLDTERKITDAGLAQISAGLLPKGSVLLSSRAPIGYLAIAEVPVAVNQGFIVMRPRPDTSNLYLLRWVNSALGEIVSHANGSTFLEISKTSFRPLRLVVPSKLVMVAFDVFTRPFYQKVVEHERQIQDLGSLRDALLPSLISGELRDSKGVN